MNKKKFIAVLLVLAVGIGGFFGWRQYSNRQDAPKENTVQQTSETEKNNEVITYKGVSDKTALEQLKSLHAVTTKTYSFGELVESIDGVQGTGPKYWTFYVNGKMSDEGAGTYHMQPSDVIEWKLEQQ